jgi:hypothetical protein
LWPKIRYVREGAVNSYHKLLLLEAHTKALLSGKKWEAAVKNDFEKAINVCGRAGFLQDRAIAHRLLGEYFLSRNRGVDAKSHLARAHSLFLEWGAKVVASHLEIVHSDTLTTDGTSKSSDTRRSIGTGLKARSRFGGLMSSWKSSSSKSELLSRSLTTTTEKRELVATEAPGNRNMSSSEMPLHDAMRDTFGGTGTEFFSGCEHEDTPEEFLRKVPEIHVPSDKVHH